MAKPWGRPELVRALAMAELGCTGPVARPAAVPTEMRQSPRTAGLRGWGAVGLGRGAVVVALQLQEVPLLLQLLQLLLLLQ